MGEMVNVSLPAPASPGRTGPAEQNPAGWPLARGGQGPAWLHAGGRWQQALAAPAPQHPPATCTAGPRPFLREAPKAEGFPVQGTQAGAPGLGAMLGAPLGPAWISGHQKQQRENLSPLCASCKLLHVRVPRSKDPSRLFFLTYFHRPSLPFQYEIKEKRGGGSRRAVAGKKSDKQQQLPNTPLK